MHQATISTSDLSSICSCGIVHQMWSVCLRAEVISLLHAAARDLLQLERSWVCALYVCQKWFRVLSLKSAASLLIHAQQSLAILHHVIVWLQPHSQNSFAVFSGYLA